MVRVLSSITVLLPFLGFTYACPFHGGGTGESTRPANNQRRSVSNATERTAIQDVRVFDGSHFTVPKTICIDSGWIVDTDGCTNPTTTVNGTGKFLIPGLIDNHLHLTDVESMENFTSWGCTTAMHMNCANYTQCHINADTPGLADFRWAGQSAVGNGSHHSQTAFMRPNSTFIYPDTDVVQFVQFQFNNGSDFMKITAEVLGPSTQQQIDMVETTHRMFHAQTMTHASEVMAYQQAVESGTDGIQHVPDDGILDDDILQRIIEQGQYVTPTLNVFEFAYRDTILQQYFAVSPGSNRTLSHAETNAQRLYRAGVPIIAGTDAVGSLTMDGTTVQVPFGLTLHFELQNLVNIVGMSPAEAINAATRDAAKWHRVPDRGSIEVQKRADLVMLNADPLVNINNTMDIAKIWVFGSEFLDVARVDNSTIANPTGSPLQ